METIQLKSIDPLSQELLRHASRQGIALNWERYERQQPQDGFARLGLSCPIGCLQGPCRIDPFYRGAEQGICGLDRDGMAAASLMKIALQGFLEILGKSNIIPAGITWPAPLAGMVSAALGTLGGGPLAVQEAFADALLLRRPSASPGELLRNTLRLGLMTLALQQRSSAPQAATSHSLHVGYGFLAEDKATIGVVGNPPREIVSSLVCRISTDRPSLQVLSLGDWVPLDSAYLPFAGTSGEAELIISSGGIDLLVAGPEADPSLRELCCTLEIPFILAGEGTANVEEIVRAARAARLRRRTCLQADPALMGEGRILSTAGLKKRLAKSGRAIALIGGADDLVHPLGHLPLELAAALSGEGFAVAAWGDAALWMVKNGSADAKQKNPVLILDKGPLSFVAALGKAGKLGDLGGICFTGLRHCSDLALAFGLSALGLKVCLASPVPLWGSEKVRELLREILAQCGGALTYFDHPADLQDILPWFTGK